MKKILVIDDDPDISEAIELVLTSNGYNAVTTIKGNEVFKFIKIHNPDLIILDLLLSGNDGKTICEKLKKDPLTKNIPIIMISAHPGAKKVALKARADSFVSKPFAIDELLLEVEKYTNKN